MKQVLKRFMAAVLLLCLLSSFFVPATFADTASEGRVVATYDIWLYDASLGGEEGYNSLFPNGSGKHVALSSLKDDIDTLYNATEGLSLNWTYVTSANETNLVYRSSSMLLRLRGSTNNWCALKIKVPESGNFSLTYGVDNTVAANNGSISAWVFPVSALAEDTSVDKIASLMTAENSVGTKDMTGSSKITFDAKDYTAGEYVVVYQGSINDIWLSELTLVDTGAGSETTETTTEPDGSESDTQVAITYDIWLYDKNLSNDEGYNGLMGYNDAGGLLHTKLADIAPQIETLYNATEGLSLNWTYMASANESNLQYRASSMLLRLRGGTGNWAALKIKVPESGNFTLTYGVDTTVASNNGSISAWVFPVSALAEDTSVDKIASLMTPENSVGTKDMTGSSKITFDPVSFTAGEYIVVYQGSINDIWLGELGLVEQGGQTPPETTQQTTAAQETTAPTNDSQESIAYDFQVYENADFASGFTYTSVLSDYQGHRPYNSSITIEQWFCNNYPSVINWGMETSGGSYGTLKDFTWRGKSDQGLRLGAKEAGQYVAMRFYVPVAGEYNVNLTAGNLAGMFDVYMFAASTEYATQRISKETIAAAMADSANLVADNLTLAAEGEADLGKWSFGEAGDYIVVFKAEAEHADGISLRTMTLSTGNEESDPTDGPSEPEGPVITTCGGTYTDGTYNFAVYTEETRAPMFTAGGNLIDRRYDSKCYVCGQTNEKCLAAQYAAGQLNWVLEGTSFGNITFMGGTHRENGYGGVRFRYDTDENGQPIMVPDSKTGELENQETPGNFVAYRVKVAKAGTYTLTVNRDYPAGFAADVFVFPAAAAKMSRSDLTAALTEENKVGAAEFVATTASSKVGDYTFDTAGEYIIAIKTTSGKRLYLNTITLTEPVPDAPIPAVDEKIYDFDLSANDQAFLNKPINGRYNADGSVRIQGAIDQMYADGKILWKYETKSSTMENSVISFREGCIRFKSATNFRDLENQWVAFRIKNPGTATYDIRLLSNGVSRSYANIYLIPATSVLTMSEEQIKAGMTEENLLVKGAVFDDKGTYYLGGYTFGTEEEYFVVFEFTKGTLLYMSDLQMTLDGTVADGTVKKEKYINGTVYDFDVNDPLNGWFTESKIYMPDILSDLNAMWYNGTLKWKWETSSYGDAPGTGHRFYKNTGMRFFHKADAWVAVRIKSPGSGTYTLTMNHALQVSGGTTAVYILPGDTEDVEKAMDPKNRVGKVAMYNDGISTAVEDGKTSFIGYWDFEAGKEYIMVFESYKASPYSNNSYMNISQVIAQKGKIEYSTGEDKTVVSVTVQENVVPVADALGDGLITDIYGHDYYFLPVEGGYTLVYDLDTGELMDRIHTGYSRTTDMRQGEDGIVWISGAGKYIVRYDPYTKETSRTPVFNNIDWMQTYSGAYTICPTPDGKLWFATYYRGVLGVYDPQTQEYREVGPAYEGTVSQYHGMIYHDGFLYVAMHSDTNLAIIKFDMETEQVVGTVDVTHMAGTAKYLNNLSMLGDGDYLVAGINSNSLDGFICVDPKTMELYEDHGMFGGLSMNATEVIDGKQYLVISGYGLYEYDVETKQFAKTPGFGNEGIGFRSSGNSLVTLDGDRCLLTWTTSGGHPRYFNLDTQEYKAWDNLVVHGGGGATIRSVVKGAPDSGEIHIGVFNSNVSGIYSTKTGQLEYYYKTGGQGDSAVWYEGKLYTGNYSSTTLNEIYPGTKETATYPPTNEYIQRWKLDHEETGQKRVHELTAGDGYVFAGTIPDTGEYGGAVVVYDTATGRWFYERNVVQDCAVTGLEYYDGLLYGATSTSPGTGTTVEAPEGLSAKIFVYDYENREVVATMDPREHIKGLPSQIPFIGGLGQDPVVEGRFWAVVSETLFCFTYDTDNKTFQVQEVISFDKTTFDSSSSKPFWCKNVLFDTERNLLYYSFDTNGGFQCIALTDWDAPIGEVKVSSNNRIMADAPQYYVLGDDGELYYSNGTDLKMMPLNVTDEDWEIAGAVDKMITDLGEITLESEAGIKSAFSAYENLSWRYKALIQQLDLLQEAETDLLECKIDTVVLEEVDADSVPELQEYVDTYNGFNTRQQKYVKNYGHLVEAYNKATELNDARVAAAMQARMDALKEKFPLTLEDEPEVLELRADYDALTGPQRVLVDATALEDAEAQIKALRAEYVKYVETLIQAIPDEITLDAEEVITTARAAADKLYANERKNVSYSKLTSAEASLRKLQTAKAAADEVDLLIDAIGIVTLGDKERIAEARDAYDALNDTALGYLTRGKQLERAEWTLKFLQTWGIPAITIANAGIVFAIFWFVPSLRKKVFKSKKKEENTEVIDN